jgi:hypothetical protein
MTSQAGKPAEAGGPRPNGDGRSVPKATSKVLPDRLQHDFRPRQTAHPDAALPVLSRQGQTVSTYTAVPYTEYDDDEHLPLPSAFRAAPEKPRSWLLHQLKAGLFGLVLGLALVVPTVFWMTGRLGDISAILGADMKLSADVVDAHPVETGSRAVTSETGSRAATSEIASRAVVKETASRAVASVGPIATSPEPDARPTPEEKRQNDAEDLLKRAQGMIGDGNMVRAREILSDAVLAENPRGLFALAETYDPNILAATGARDVRAEVERARMLYAKALAGGVAAAENRLNALK